MSERWRVMEQFELIAAAHPEGLDPGDLISKPDEKALQCAGLVCRRSDGRSALTARGLRVWLDWRQVEVRA